MTTIINATGTRTVMIVTITAGAIGTMIGIATTIATAGDAAAGGDTETTIVTTAITAIEGFTATPAAATATRAAAMATRAQFTAGEMAGTWATTSAIRTAVTAPAGTSRKTSRSIPILAVTSATATTATTARTATRITTERNTPGAMKRATRRIIAGAEAGGGTKNQTLATFSPQCAKGRRRWRPFLLGFALLVLTLPGSGTERREIFRGTPTAEFKVLGRSQRRPPPLARSRMLGCYSDRVN